MKDLVAVLDAVDELVLTASRVQVPSADQVEPPVNWQLHVHLSGLDCGQGEEG